MKKRSWHTQSRRGSLFLTCSRPTNPCWFLCNACVCPTGRFVCAHSGASKQVHRGSPEIRAEVGSRVGHALRFSFLYDFMGSALISRAFFGGGSLSSIFARLSYSLTTQKWMQLVLKTLSFPHLVGYIYYRMLFQH